MMQTFVRPSRDLRNHYAEISDMLKDHDHVIITNHGRGESVLINIEDYAKYEEFLHQRYVAEELAKAKQHLLSGTDLSTRPLTAGLQTVSIRSSSVPN